MTIHIDQMELDSSDLELSSAVFDVAADALVVVDCDGRVRAVNKSTTEMFGYERPELIGRQAAELVPGAFEEPVVGGRELVGRRSDGQEFPLYLNIGEFWLDDQRMCVAVGHDISERKRMLERSVRLAQTDGLTSCVNRKTFLGRLENRIDHCRMTGESVAVLFIDLDDFKDVNDSFGHSVGDEVICAAAARIRGTLRETDVLGRVGGDEFAAFIEVEDPSEAREVARRVAARIVESVRQPFEFGYVRADIGASVGISVFSKDTAGPLQLVTQADMAMYEAKANGDTGVSLYGPALRDRLDHSHELVSRLRDAIENDGFVLRFQPMVALPDGAPIGIEMLLRLPDDDGGLIRLGEFLPTALKYGLMPEITRLVITKTIREIAEIRRHTTECLPVSVNVSPACLSDPDFVPWVVEALGAAGVPNEFLQLEITEEVVLHDHVEAQEALRRLAGHGIGVVMDDFGVGYSSLSRLRELPISRLKLDRVFIADLLNSTFDRSIVESTFRLTQAVGIDFLVEGIETSEQAEVLTGIGCTQGQGFLFGEPMSLDELLVWLHGAGA